MWNRNHLFAQFFAVALALTAGPALAGAKEQGSRLDYQAVEQKMAATLETIEQYGAEQKQQAVKKAKAAVKALDRDIDRLETELHQQRESLSAGARKEKKQALSTLREQRAELKSAWRDMKQETGDAWNEAQKAFHDTYRKAKEQWRELAS